MSNGDTATFTVSGRRAIYEMYFLFSLSLPPLSLPPLLYSLLCSQERVADNIHDKPGTGFSLVSFSGFQCGQMARRLSDRQKS